VREREKKENRPKIAVQKKVPPLLFFLNTTFEHLFLAAVAWYIMVPLESTQHYLHKLLLNNYLQTY
jgi:hypothetical protein